MKVLVVLAVMFVVAHAASFEEHWQEFKLNHGKTYKSLLEEKRRFAVFQDNVRVIEKHNEKFAKGEESYEMGINQFSDMTEEEFRATLSPMTPKPLHKEYFNDTGLVGDSTINWVTRGVVSPVKNQGSCGSCWAFAAVDTIESQVALAGGGIVLLSPQNLVDCSRNGNNGCDGGLMTYAYDYIQQRGVLPEDKYPYVGRQGVCRAAGGRRISTYYNVVQTEAALLRVLTSVGPVAVAVDANHLQSYRSGIVNARSRCTNNINHGVVLVGAGVQNGTPYWLIKNSWGTTWGEKGYFKLIRGANACGINLMNSVPQL